jgi:DUF438 domain-containing protein
MTIYTKMTPPKLEKAAPIVKAMKKAEKKNHTRTKKATKKAQIQLHHLIKRLLKGHLSRTRNLLPREILRRGLTNTIRFADRFYLQIAGFS